MEPRIIKGHRYLCKKTVTMCIIKEDGREKKTDEEAYTKGNVYRGCSDYGYPGDKHTCGFITDNKGDAHAWPYDPEHHLWSHDSWTDFFDDLDKTA